MDSIHHHHQNQDNQDSQNLDGNAPYAFNNAPTDAFNSYFNSDTSTFNNPWDTEVLNDPRIQTNGFAQGNDAWHHQNSLGAANTLHNPPFGVQSRDYSNAYVRNPSAFRYGNFDNPPGHSFGSPAFDPALYSNDALNHGPDYEMDRSGGYVTSSTQGQTISPQALQSFPYGQFPALAENTQDPPPFSQEPLSLSGSSESTRIPAQLPPATKPKKFSGFVFLGGNPTIEELTEDDFLERIPKKHRKSKNELKFDLNKQQGIQPEPKDEELRDYLKQLNIRRPKVIRQGSTSAVSSSSSEGSDRDSETVSQSGSDDGSDYNSGSEEEVAGAKPAILLSARPGHPAKAVEFDVTKSVWRKGKVITSAPELRQALGDFWNIIKPIRDQWLLDVAFVQKAEAGTDRTSVEEAKSRASRQRQYLEIAMRVALEHGHRDILARFGDNPHLLLFFYKLIIDRFIDNDFNGKLVTDIISLVIRCSTVDQPLLEKTKLDKALAKLLKRGDDTVKALAQEALDSVARYTKQKELEVKSAQKPISGSARGLGINEPVAPSVRGTQPSNSLKRQRESSTSSVQPAKKIAPSVSSTKSNTNVPVKATGGTNKGKVVPKSDSKSAASTNASIINTKAKVNHVVVKPSTFFSSLQSASKKPGTSNAAIKAAQHNESKTSKSAEGKAAPTLSTAAAVPKPAFSFAETMANLTKPKEITSTIKATENLPPESEEERAKRLRKEERRKLRVTFKPQESLVEIRLFIHDPEEEMGHDDNMIRDVGDIGSEGRMLKKNKEMGFENLEDDEDNEVNFAPWIIPSLVDFSVIDAEELARSCATRGGKVEAKSLERAVQQQRELTTLVTFYATASDIPSSPREPIDPYSGNKGEELVFGTPLDETRHREAQYYATKNMQTRSFSQQTLSGGTTQTPDISALLQILKQQPQQQQVPQSQPPASQLEAIFAQYSHKNPSAAQTSASQQQSAHSSSLANTWAGSSMIQQSQPPIGYAQPNLQSILASMSQQPATQQQNYGYQPAYQSEQDRKRQYDDHDSHRNNDSYSDKRAKGNAGKKHTPDAPYTGPKYPCRFWLEGNCRKGDQCTYLHE